MRTLSKVNYLISSLNIKPDNEVDSTDKALLRNMFSEFMQNWSDARPLTKFELKTSSMKELLTFDAKEMLQHFFTAIKTEDKTCILFLHVQDGPHKAIYE
jgi:hypothetical protein